MTHRLLKCEIEGLTYDFHAHHATLYLPAYHCTDMTGAITFCRRIDSHCRRITTIAGSTPDTTYQRLHGKTWQATLPDGRLATPAVFR